MIKIANWPLFLLITFLVLMPFSAQAKDRLFGIDFKVGVMRGGQPVKVYKDDQRELRKRLTRIFNSHKVSTKQMWFKQSFGETGPEGAWAEHVEGSYFALYRETPKDEEHFIRNEIDPEKVIVTINTSGKGKLFGEVLAKMRDGSVRAYEVGGKELVNLYCLDKAAKYLPDSYAILRENYLSEDHIKAGIKCSTEKNK